MYRLLTLLSAALLIGGCASSIPHSDVAETKPDQLSITTRTAADIADNHNPTVIEQFRKKLDEQHSLRQSNVITEEEYQQAREHTVKSLENSNYSFESDELKNEIGQLADMKKDGHITADEYNAIRGAFVQTYLNH